MKKRRFSDIQRFTSIIIVLVLIIYVGLRFFWGDLSFLHNLYEPFGISSSYLKDYIDPSFDYIVTMDTLVKDNRNLKKQLNKSNLSLQNYQEVIQENIRLKKLLNVKKIDTYSQKVGNIIGKSPDIWHQEIIANLGQKDGVTENTIFVNALGLIGRAKSVTDDSSVIQLITDNSNWVSCQNNRSRAIGMLKVEDNKRGKLSYLINKSDFKQNDLIVTSGLGGIYPKGIPVGNVNKVIKKQGDDIPEIDISLLSDFDHIEEVIALIKNKSEINQVPKSEELPVVNQEKKDSPIDEK
ncbi:MAG: rod shape-determining protein MreC [Candidatus Sericytochromatia bacterium]|nr:rod shape-determining protein MreC [Candidatus Sericytochromatia bacterium]